MIRGAVYQIDLGQAKRGYEQRGKRYAIVVSPSNSPLSLVTVIPTSTSAFAGIYRPVVDFDGRPTRALVDRIRSIDEVHLGGIAGFLTRNDMAQVEVALANYLSLIPRTQ